MKVLFCIVLIALLMYLLDLCVCLFYCTKKKQIDKIKLDYVVNSHSNIKSSDNNKKKKKSYLYTYLRNFLNGWILYRIQTLGRVPCQTYRIWKLKHIFKMDLSEDVVIYRWNTIRSPWNISIGKGSVIGDGVILDGRNFISIGKNVNLSTAVSIYTEQHDINDSLFRSLNSGGKVTIGDRAWISSHTTVLPKIYIHDGAILAAGAVATKNLEEFSIYAGIPAKKIGNRNKELDYEFNGEFIPFF